MPSTATAQPWATHFEAIQDHALLWLRRSGYDELSALDLWHTAVAQVLASGTHPDPARVPAAYLWTVTRRVASRERSSRQARPDRAGEAALGRTLDESPDPGERCVASEERGRVRAAVDTLPDRFRQVVERRYFLGRSVAEVAAELAIPDNTVASRTHRALRMLAPRLADLRAVGLAALVGGVALAALVGRSTTAERDLHATGVALHAAHGAPAPRPVAAPTAHVEHPRDTLASAPRAIAPSAGFPYGEGWVMRPMPEI